MGAPLRIPLAGAYNTRVSAVNASDTSGGYVGVGIVGLMIVGKTTPSVGKDARYVNCFAQTVSDPITGAKKVYTVKRPGFGTNTTPATGKKGYAILVWTGKGNGTDVVSAFDNPSTAYNGTTSLGALTGKCTGITETFVSTTPTLTLTADDSTGWYYDTTSGLVKISDVDFPGNAGKTLAGTFAHIDGYACVLATDGTLWASDLNSVTAWTATSFDSANSYPDKGVACVRQGQFIIAFGTESMQFFYNQGLTPFPLAKATAKTVRVGCVSADAVGQISDTTFWAGSTPQGGLSVFQFDGSLNRISTPEIDAQLLLAGASNISITTIRLYGRSFVLVSCSTVQTFAYCVEEKMWHEWSSTTPLWYKCAAASIGGTMVNYAVSNVSTSGKVYLMNHASLVFTDDSTAYTARVQLPLLDLGTNRMKFWGNPELIGDIESSSSPITLSYSDDDYQNYTTWGTLDLSQARNIATRTGASRRRAWVLSHAASTPMRLEALEWPNGVTVGNA